MGPGARVALPRLVGQKDDPTVAARAGRRRRQQGRPRGARRAARRRLHAQLDKDSGTLDFSIVQNFAWSCAEARCNLFNFFRKIAMSNSDLLEKMFNACLSIQRKSCSDRLSRFEGENPMKKSENDEPRGQASRTVFWALPVFFYFNYT